MFKLAHRVTLRDLRNLLISYKVPVDTPKRGLSCANALQACLKTGLATFHYPCNVPGLVQGLERAVLGTF
jgi:hypothetical protein